MYVKIEGYIEGWGRFHFEGDATEQTLADISDLIQAIREHDRSEANMADALDALQKRNSKKGGE